MATTLRTTGKSANDRVSDLSGDQESLFPNNSINSLVMRVAQTLWPTKTDMHLAHRTGTSDRMCRYWLANKYKLSVDDLAALLRSEEGLEVLTAMMGNAKPVWWAGFKRGVKRAELRRQAKAIQKALDDDEQGEFGI